MNAARLRWLGWIVASLMIGYVATTWLLKFALRTDAASASTAAPVLARDVFARVPAAQISAISAPQVAADIQLLGTLLPDRARKDSVAVLRVNGKSLMLRLGERLPDASEIVRIERRAITVRSPQGEREITLSATALPAQKSTSPNFAATSAIATPTQKIEFASGCPASAEERRVGVVLGAEMLAGVLQNTSSLTNIVQVVGNGLKVQNTAGIGALIGLRDGDLLRSADGKRLNAAADLAQLALTPLTQGKRVVIEFERNSAPQVLRLLPPGCKA